VSCKSIDLESVAEQLKSKRYANVGVTGKKHLYRDGREWIEKLR